MIIQANLSPSPIPVFTSISSKGRNNEGGKERVYIPRYRKIAFVSGTGDQRNYCENKQ